jgi:hypothetical protein
MTLTTPAMNGRVLRMPRPFLMSLAVILLRNGTITIDGAILPKRAASLNTFLSSKIII